MIGDSQWIGGAAENGHYIKLNDFFDANGIKMEDFIPATVTGYAEWPKNTPNYWALPAFGDVVGWTYRKDWFERPELQAEFKEKYGRDLARARRRFAELKDIAEFFQGREIDGKTVYGAAIYTERGSEGITMGAMDVLYNYGFEYENPDKPYELDGFVNSPERGRGPRVLQGALRLLHPAGGVELVHVRGHRRLQVGPGGAADELRLHLAGRERRPERRRRQVRLLPQPGRARRRQFAQLGGQGISVVANSPTARTRRSSTSSGSPSPRCRRSGGRWAATRRSTRWSTTRASPPASPMPRPSSNSMAIVKDFWAEPAYASLLLAMQERFHDYVVAGNGTAQEALDGLVEDWTEVFEDDGKM